ncbi:MULTISPECIES: HEAT repeat domain-containing protein [unclassified Streptomyces]|uniref:HEAT repeat domain-containing protein n=1 Tax=unclassified Streptomyces TaxID=2593676 RepID=UPI0029B7378E|nr:MULTISPECIES: HEAT repeat domain-containing protein [unclassified Streptomyces]MDX3771410.1 HEAT repeat domain-containing protein [Streptomyces sp. AK08-01B]MDX3818953.1 HEAT repeat domain-containing protein [Streptomyces sp. AK08-01A]
MEDQRAAGDLTLRLDELAAGLADPDRDLDDLAEIEEELVAARRRELIPYVERHLAAAVEAGNWYARHALAPILAETAGHTALAALLRAYSRDLGDDQDSLSTTLHVLAQENPAAAREIILPCAVGNDEDLRRAAIWLLGFVPEPADLNLLAHAAQASDEGIRSAVVGTLGSHGTEPAAIALLLQLLADPSPQVRISALSSLGFLQQPRTLQKIRSLANDDSPRVRAWVAIALSNFSALEPADLATSAVLDQLAADADPYVRDQAAAARQRKPLRR